MKAMSRLEPMLFNTSQSAKDDGLTIEDRISQIQIKPEKLKSIARHIQTEGKFVFDLNELQSKPNLVTIGLESENCCLKPITIFQKYTP